MASAEQLKMTHSVDGKVMGVDDRVRGVEGRVEGVRGDVQDVRIDVRDVGNKVQDVNDKLDQANRSFSFRTPHRSKILRAQTASQGTCLEIISYDGFHPQIHPQITTLHAKPITTAQRNGFSKEVYSITGNLLAPSCGYTENVRYFWPLHATTPDRPDHPLFL
jgi:hypothetical protein